MLKKEAVFGGRTGDGSSVWVSRGQVHGKNPGTEGQAATRVHHGRKRRFQKQKEKKMGDSAGSLVAKNLCSHCRGPGFDS